MIRTIAVLLVGLGIIVVTAVAYYYWVGRGAPISTLGEDWAVFGSYFGGVAGALLSFVSVILILFTIHQQRRQIAATEDENRKNDLLLHISKADEEIERWLHKRLASTTDGQTVEFGDVAWGLVRPGYVQNAELAPALERLLKLTCTYCGAIALYEANINTHFIYQQHRQKAQDLVAFLEKHISVMSQMTGPSLLICKHHLNGNAQVQ